MNGNLVDDLERAVSALKERVERGSVSDPETNKDFLAAKGLQFYVDTIKAAQE